MPPSVVDPRVNASAPCLATASAMHPPASSPAAHQQLCPVTLLSSPVPPLTLTLLPQPTPSPHLHGKQRIVRLLHVQVRTTVRPPPFNTTLTLAPHACLSLLTLTLVPHPPPSSHLHDEQRVVGLVYMQAILLLPLTASPLQPHPHTCPSHYFLPSPP